MSPPVITAFNLFIFTVGGFQWGKAVWLPGTVILLLFVPFYFYRKMVQDKQPGMVHAATYLPELKEGQDDLGGRREVIHKEKPQ